MDVLKWKTLVLASILSVGCASSNLPKGAEAHYEPTRVRVYPVEICPSLKNKDAALPQSDMFLGGIGELFLGTLIQAGVNTFSTALSEAAKEDKDGTAYKRQMPGYLYVSKPEGISAKAVAAQCLIVVVGGPNNLGRVCESDMYVSKPAFRSACSNGNEVLEHASCNDSKAKCANNHRPLAAGESVETPTKLPRLYAEIALWPASDLSSVQPELVNLYYPYPFNSRRSSKTRDLAFSIQISTPDGKSTSNILLTKSGLMPSPDKNHQGNDLDDAVGLWAVLPKYTGIALSPKNDGRRVGAVNITAEVRETGEINKFLQAFAASFESDKGKYSDALKSSILPSSVASEQATETKGEASVLEARAALEKAKSDFVAACAKAIGGEKGYANDNQRDIEIERHKRLIDAAWKKLVATQIENDKKPDNAAPAYPTCPPAS